MFITPNLKKPSFKTPSLSNSIKSNKSNCNFTPLTDRYIPNRSINNFEKSHHLLTSETNNIQTASKNSENYLTKRKLFLEVCPETVPFQSRVLSLSCKAISKNEREEMQIKDLCFKYNTNLRMTPRNVKRTLPKTADTVLDAPNVIDDFYLNLLDWSDHNGKLAVAMSGSLYIWNENTKTAENIVWDDESDDHYITSVKWVPNKNALSVAKSNNIIYIWDICKMKCISKIKDHTARVATISWNENLISSGNQLGLIMNHDIRLFNSNKISEFKFHKDDICKLTWCKNGKFLACGSDDKIVSIWDKSSVSSLDNSSKPIFAMQGHTAAVKAIDWCPWNSGLLATGGGRTDGTIKTWNVFTGGVSKSLETDSQITGLLWASNTRELISSHGCPDNKVSIWKFPNLEKVGDLMGHSERILSIALSKNGESVASFSADETLRLWQCFKCTRNNSVFSTPVIGISNLQNIR